MRDARSLALHSKDLVVIETKTGCLETLTLDFDNSETSTDLHCITQVTCRTTLTLTPVLRSVLVEYCVLYCRVFVVELSPSWVPIVWILVISFFLRDPLLSADSFRSALKTHLFAAQWDTFHSRSQELERGTRYRPVTPPHHLCPHSGDS